MGEVFLKLINMSITASWLILAVVLLRLVLKKAPKALLCALWALVAVRLICPFSFESMFSLIPSAETVPQDIAYSQSPGITSGMPALNSALNPVISDTFTPAAEASINPLQVWTAVASIVWLTGLVAMLVYALISFLKIIKRVREAVPLRDNILICDHIDTPFILGVFRPRIYLPSAIDDERSDYVLTHENAHLKRRDHLWKPLGFLLLSVYWFNPFCWLAYWLLCKDIELACDEKVIRDLDEHNKKAYSEALLSCSVPRRMIAACPLAFGEVGVKERIKTVLNYKKPAFWVIVAAVVACVVVAVCFLTNPASPPVSFGGLQIAWAKALDMRPNEPTTRDLDRAQLEELKSRLKYLSVGRKDSDFGGFTPMYSISIYAQNIAAQFAIISYDVDGNKLALYYENEYYRINDAEFASYLSAVCAGEDVAFTEERTLTISDVMTLSEKGNALTWSDFDNYAYTEGGGGLYIRFYEIDARFHLMIGGPYPGEEPWYIRLVSEADRDDYIDVRTESVRDFIDTHKAGSVSTVGGVDASGVTVSEVDPLEAAIHAAILNENQSGLPDGLLHCESHVVLEQETISATPLAGETDHKVQVIVYATVLYQEYGFSAGAFDLVSGSHIPTVMTFDVNADGEYTLAEYWRPRDGSLYEPDIREKFPSHIEEDALNPEKYTLAQRQNCYAQAVEFFKVDTDVVIEGLLKKICSSPTTSSNPEDYIGAHPIEYRKLTYYGDYTLHYVFSEFLKGGQTDLRGHIMRSVMNDLIGDEALKLAANTGQEYFDAWRATVERIYGENDAAFMLENMPKAWLLLQKIN